jgi:hypothetical protein
MREVWFMVRFVWYTTSPLQTSKREPQVSEKDYWFDLAN